MVRGLTDRESLAATMQEARAVRQTSDRVRELAAKGLRDPNQLTPDETRELCGAVVRLLEKRHIGSGAF